MNDELAPAAIETAEPAETAVAEQKPTEAVPSEAKPEKSAEQKELEYLRRKATKADRNNSRLYQENESFKTRLEQLERSQPQERQKVEVDPQEYETTVRTQAKELARAERMNEKINAFVEKGKTQFPDFTDAVTSVASDLPLLERNGAPTPALEAILDSDEPAALLHYLGKNPDIAADLADLSPTQLARRLVKIESEINKPPQPSAAPKPHEPEKSGSGPTGMPDAAKDPKAWMKWRNEQEKAKRQR